MKIMSNDKVYRVGEEASFSKTITEADILLYAGVSGDLNPVHIDQEYANTSIFKNRIAHGLIPAGFISTVLGTILPGPGTIYVSQTLSFIKPIYIGDTIRAIATIKEIDNVKNRITLETICKNQNDLVVINGEAVVMPPK